MSIQVGDRLPDIKVMRAGDQGPEQTTTGELFAGKKVALFAVPGAFTPTCSAKHVPSFTGNADKLAAKGIELIACISVNDAFVMGAWAKDQSPDGRIVMLADGNGTFTKAVGLELDASAFGMGTRSKRYSMVVDDMVVKALYVEEGGAFKVSSGEYMLERL